MTQVDFHSGVGDKVRYACRLLRKAARQGARVQVCGPAEEVGLLDRALWTFEPGEFLPHVRLVPGAAPAPLLHRTAIWLTEPQQAWPEGLEPAAVLVNLGPGSVEAAPHVQRVIEIVADDPQEVQAGRLRWREWAERGLKPVHHTVRGE